VNAVLAFFWVVASSQIFPPSVIVGAKVIKIICNNVENEDKSFG
jgi:hypothetical protein